MYYKYYKHRQIQMWAPATKIMHNGIPLKIDLYNSCQMHCRYCYAREFRAANLAKDGIKLNPLIATMLDIKYLAKFFEMASKGKDYKTPFMNWAIRNRYFIEVGTMGEIFQEDDKFFRTTYEAFRLLSDFRMPLFINTKLGLVCEDEKYFKLLVEYKAPIILCVSLIDYKDNSWKKYEVFSPPITKRLGVIKELSKYKHIKTIAYISPMMPNVTDINPEEFAKVLIKHGIISVHVRDFYLQGNTFNNTFWKKYIEENKDKLEPFPGGYHVKYKVKKEFMERFARVALRLNPNFGIVGMKKNWFDMMPYHGKMNYDILPERFKQGIVDFTIIPILRKIRERINEPQLLIWDNLGYKKDKINLPERVLSNEGKLNSLMEDLCNCNTSDLNYEIEGYDWIKGVMWDGWNDNKPGGILSKTKNIFPIKKDGEYVKDNNSFVYCYLPNKYINLVKAGSGQTFFGKPIGKDLYVNYKDIEGFNIPERKGGTEDKWLN